LSAGIQQFILLTLILRYDYWPNKIVIIDDEETQSLVNSTKKNLFSSKSGGIYSKIHVEISCTLAKTAKTAKSLKILLITRVSDSIKMYDIVLLLFLPGYYFQSWILFDFMEQ